MLDIRFYSSPELNVEVPVRSDGKISLEPVGDIRAVGKRPEELSALLTELYKRELKRPQVTVIVREFGGKVYVTGAVEDPSEIEFSTGLTALQAIASAGGFESTASVESVVLIRRDAEGEPRGYLLALDTALSGKDQLADIAVQPSDILYVPKSRIGNANDVVELYIQNMLPIKITAPIL